jgi:hypothetical protein
MNSNNKSFSTLILSIICFCLVVASVTGWYKALSTDKKLKKQTKITQREFDNFDDNEDLDEELPDEKKIKTVPRPTFVESTVKNVSQCLKDPDVKKEFNKRLKKLSEHVSAKNLQDYKDEVKAKRVKRFDKRSEKAELINANAANIYTDKYGLDEQGSKDLHTIMEDITKSRKNTYEKYLKKEISRKELRTEFRKDRKLYRKDLVELLGKDEYRDFRKISRAERKRVNSEEENSKK